MTPMRAILIAFLSAPLLAAPGLADPPAHAPAYGRRAKEQRAEKAPRPKEGVEIRFDSERGIHVAVGLPGVYFEAGSYYRHTDAGWQVSATGRDGWSLAAGSTVPEIVRQTHPAPPAKAGRYGKKKKGPR
jgi:hypothetical protein